MTKLILTFAALGAALVAQTTTDINGATQSPAQTWTVINANTNSLKAAIVAHNARTDNPHATTAVQANAIPNVGTTSGDVTYFTGTTWTRLASPSDGTYCWQWTAGVPSYTSCQSMIDATSNLLIGNGSGAAVDSGVPVSTLLTSASTITAGRLVQSLGGRAMSSIALGGAGTTVPSVTGSPAVGDCVQWASGLSVTTTGAPCGAGGGGGSPTGAAGGDLTGSTYPNPTVAAGTITLAKLATAIKAGTGAKVQTTDGSGVSGQVPVYDASGALINSGVTPGGLPDQTTHGGSVLTTTGGSSAIPKWGSLGGFTYNSSTGNLTPDGTLAEVAGNNTWTGQNYKPIQATPQTLVGGSTITPTREGWGITSASAITVAGVPVVVAGVKGQELELTNMGTFDITLNCTGAQADAAVFCTGTTYVIKTKTSAHLKYNDSLAGWTVFGSSTAGGGGGTGLQLPSNSAVGLGVVTDAGTGATVARSLTASNGFTITNPTGVSANPIIVPPNNGAVKGSVMATTSAGAYAALALGTNGQLLTVDTTQTSGVKWADPATTLITSGTTVSLSAPRQYHICTGACAVTPPVPAAGDEFCVKNVAGAATVITFAAVGSGVMYEKVDGSAYGTAGTGTMVSSGAVADQACIVALDATHYTVWSSKGTWTVN